MASLLQCQDVTVRFGGILACNNVSIDVEEGKVIGLIGPNGAGKTTLFNVLTRFQSYESGTLTYKGDSIDRRRPDEMMKLGMARTFQNINLFGEQSTLANILIGSHHLIGNSIANLFWFPSARTNEARLVQRAIEIAELLHLDDELDTPVKHLAYGYQKRVELARALAGQPQIILLDEPVAGCNDEETRDLKDIIKRVNRDFGVTILLVEHDMSMVMSVCDYIHVINFGANLASGTAAEIQTNPAVIAAYLGE